MADLHKLSDISYHTGLLTKENPERWRSEGFHRMVINMELGGILDGELGYGILGTGVYHTTDAWDLIMEPNSHPKAYVIDCSYKKHHCFTPVDSDKAMTFLSHLQAFTIQKAICPEGWDKILPGMTIDNLYHEYIDAFEEHDIIPGDQFKNRIEDLINYTKNGFTGEIDEETEYPMVKDEMRYADNVVTKFLKDLGYGGVDLRGSDFDNVEHGSVIFDLSEDDIIATFDSLKDLEEFEDRFFDMSELMDNLSMSGFKEEGFVDDKVLRISPQTDFNDCKYHVDIEVSNNNPKITDICINGKSYDPIKEAADIKKAHDRLYKAIEVINKVIDNRDVVKVPDDKVR